MCVCVWSLCSLYSHYELNVHMASALPFIFLSLSKTGTDLSCASSLVVAMVNEGCL